MPRSPRTFLPGLLFASIAAHAAGLPDTGQNTCFDDIGGDTVLAASVDSIARDTGAFPRQDCRYGADAAADGGRLTRIGGGPVGFDYTKIANNGTTLPAAATLGTSSTAWACTRDNITGLTWEVKTTTNTDLRYYGHTYTWYSTDGTTNGGIIGNLGVVPTCNGTLPGIPSRCNTQAYVTAVNTAALCTYTDWRMPSPRELVTLVFAGGSQPAAVQSYIPNTDLAAEFWSGASYAQDPAKGWTFSFTDGHVSGGVFGAKSSTYAVMVVRGGPF
ncbi:MAG: DUF1566 domain-containing protein [Betaproteobacteria bacterium]